ncbi:tetratricopeptide repeat protein [Lentzea sp. NPDC102401]|uniref:tetratricopeptide repeat protein n=1 Tax=Lentzea sp. NPDC102401 TaxID=3364128 RepID=UPI003820B233
MSKSDAYHGDIAEHPLATVLHAAWMGEPAAAETLAQHKPPGPIALRSRYLHVMDASRDGTLAPVDIDRWNHAITAETLGDHAIRTGEYDRALNLFTELADDQRFDPITVTNARVGIADVHRSRGASSAAIDAYESALVASTQAGYRFGRLRALVPLAYLTLFHHSVTQAEVLFGKAAKLAEELEDRVYLANARMGAAECAQRSGALDDAATGYLSAYNMFVEVRTLTGQANAAQRLGAVWHLLGDLESARTWYVKAAEDFKDAHEPIGVVNVLEGLGDILLDTDDPDLAEVQYRAAYDVAVEHGLSHAQAHCIQNFGRVARARANWTEAAGLFSTAAAAYRDAGDLLGRCTALTKRAEMHGELGEQQDEVTALVEAVFTVEEFRAAHQDAASQHEYRSRFAEVYALALRAAVNAQDAPSFVVVADSLAGRRLVGLAAASLPPGAADELVLLQHVLASADQRWIAAKRPAGSGGMQLSPDLSARERVQRMIGARALSGALPRPAKAALEELLAAVYLPPADDGAELLEALPTNCDALQVVPDPAAPQLVHRLWRDVEGRTHLDTVQLSDECRELIAVLQQNSDEHSGLRPSQLVPLAELIPELLREAVSSSARRVLVLPVGEMWLVPWGAIPIGDRLMLGQLAEFVVCPTLGLQRVLRERPLTTAPDDRHTTCWRSPVMQALRISMPTTSSAEFAESAIRAKEALATGTHTMILMCHGRPTDGPGHYLELDLDVWLLPADILTANAPARLYLITCWGAGVPGQAMTEPLTIATLSLTKGTVEVLATIGEFGDTTISNTYVEWVLGQLDNRTVPASLAIHHATAKLMGAPGMWALPVRDWAPLLPIGTFTS